MKSVIKRLIESVVLIAVSAALWQIALLPVADTINKKLPLSMVQNLIVVLSLGILIILINIYSKKQGYLNWKTSWLDPTAVKWIIFGIVATVVLHIFSTISGYIDGIPYLDLSNDGKIFYPSIDIMTTVFLAPLAEELVFRRILTEVIFPKNLKISLIVTGILFTAFHLPVSIGDCINQLGAAFVLSMIYYKTSKVEIGIVVHSLMNLFITVIILWSIYK